jgi:hypothetical protein
MSQVAFDERVASELLRYARMVTNVRDRARKSGKNSRMFPAIHRRKSGARPKSGDAILGYRPFAVCTCRAREQSKLRRLASR